jgi:NDP-sugar pyrophosphorylase family protein
MADGQILSYDKVNRTPRMEFIDYGLGMFRPDAFAHVADGQPADLADIYESLVAQRHLLAYEVKQRFYETGSFDGLRELDQLLAHNPDQFLGKV